ncbi:MAG: TauD/TfdA family dioxygenase [Cyanobacteria bacterium J06600_6]
MRSDRMTNNLQLLSPFGVEATGLKITNLGNQVERIKTAIAQHGFIVFRKQWIGDEEFLSFLNNLGQLTFTVGEKPVKDAPLLNIVTNVGRDCPPRSVFHTDTSYVNQPPAFTALRIIKVPSSGGETLFSDQYRAYETLPQWVKKQLASAKVLHMVSGLILDGDLETQCWHPLFRRHPISGRIALYLSTPERCQAISNVKTKSGRRILKLLYKHSIRQSRLYRHQWQAGDIVVWDNRCTMHRADHSQVIGDRVLHRGLVAGERPIEF